MHIIYTAVVYFSQEGPDFLEEESSRIIVFHLLFFNFEELKYTCQVFLYLT